MKMLKIFSHMWNTAGNSVLRCIHTTDNIQCGLGNRAAWTEDTEGRIHDPHLLEVNAPDY